MYCLSVVGTQNAHNLISVSTDGRLCSWSLDMLSQPQETLELQHRQSKAIAAMCLAFPHNDVNNFVVGSEEGAVYSGEKIDNRPSETSKPGPKLVLLCQKGTESLKESTHPVTFNSSRPLFRLVGHSKQFVKLRSLKNFNLLLLTTSTGKCGQSFPNNFDINQC